MFSVMTEKGFDSEVILKNINNKLYRLLPTDMFMAACMVEIRNNQRSACVWNSGMPDVYLLDGKTGGVKQRIRSTHIPLGINEEIDSRMEFEDFDIEPGDQFIMHSDGLTDAVNTSGDLFGTRRLVDIMCNHAGRQVFDGITNEFNRFCMNQALSDDATLVAVPCGENLNRASSLNESLNVQTGHADTGGWRFMVEVSGDSLRTIDPVPIVLEQYQRLDDQVVCVDRLESVLAALYDNALNHGVLELDHVIDPSVTQGDGYQRELGRRFDSIPYGFVRIEIQHIGYQGEKSLLLKLEDSGRGFDHASLLADISSKIEKDSSSGGGGIPLVRGLCQALHFQGSGNRVEVIIGRQKRNGN